MLFFDENDEFAHINKLTMRLKSCKVLQELEDGPVARTSTGATKRCSYF